MNNVSREKYTFSLIFGCVLVIIVGNIYGAVSGRGFGDIFVLFTALLFIIPIFALTIMLGFPVFSYLMEKEVNIWFFIKVLYSGIASGFIPMAVFTSIFSVIFGWHSTFMAFIELLLVLFAISIPFAFSSALIYCAVGNRL